MLLLGSAQVQSHVLRGQYYVCECVLEYAVGVT